MKELTLQIPDEQYETVLAFVETMPQIQVKKERKEDSLTPSQHETWENIKGGFEAYKSVKEGKKQARLASEFLAELKAEGLL